MGQTEKKGSAENIYYKGLSAHKITMKYRDPVKQAEHAYSWIKKEVSG